MTLKADPAKIRAWQQRSRRALKRSRLRSVSTKKAVKNRRYRELRERFLQENPICQRCTVRESQDVHHTDGRGKNLNRTETWLALCRPCHEAVHQNPNQARKDGHLK